MKRKSKVEKPTRWKKKKAFTRGRFAGRLREAVDPMSCEYCGNGRPIPRTRICAKCWALHRLIRAELEKLVEEGFMRRTGQYREGVHGLREPIYELTELGRLLGE